jgi:hypothetical protein
MNKQLVWYTGSPGSKWSGIANIIQSVSNLNFDISDRSPEREYKHTKDRKGAGGITHTGAYFGPGHGMGELFHQLPELDYNEVENEIVSQWSMLTSKRLLVKSHFFTKHLHYISETWPNSPIIMITRPPGSCFRGWIEAGGWNITYPRYREFYKDEITIEKCISEHNSEILEFCKNKNLELKNFNSRYMKETFNFDLKQIDNLNYRTWVERHLVHTEKFNDISIAIYNIENLIN